VVWSKVLEGASDPQEGELDVLAIEEMGRRGGWEGLIPIRGWLGVLFPLPYLRWGELWIRSSDRRMRT
jgi:hypothetical protein